MLSLRLGKCYALASHCCAHLVNLAGLPPGAPTDAGTFWHNLGMPSWTITVALPPGWVRLPSDASADPEPWARAECHDLLNGPHSINDPNGIVDIDRPDTRDTDVPAEAVERICQKLIGVLGTARSFDTRPKPPRLQVSYLAEDNPEVFEFSTAAGDATADGALRAVAGGADSPVVASDVAPRSSGGGTGWRVVVTTQATAQPNANDERATLHSTLTRVGWVWRLGDGLLVLRAGRLDSDDQLSRLEALAESVRIEPGQAEEGVTFRTQRVSEPAWDQAAVDTWLAGTVESRPTPPTLSPSNLHPREWLGGGLVVGALFGCVMMLILPSAARPVVWGWCLFTGPIFILVGFIGRSRAGRAPPWLQMLLLALGLAALAAFGVMSVWGLAERAGLL